MIAVERRRFLAGVACATCCSIVGCVKDEGGQSGAAKEPVYKCAVCGKVMAKDAYCVECNAVAALPGKVHCDQCGMDKDAGVYCGKCNRFMFSDQIECEKAGKTITKGTFCPKKKAYRRLPTAGYCETCKKPFDKATGCPTCQAKAAQG